MDIRPSNCRFRLKDEGKPYPRSSCKACKRGLMQLGNECQYIKPHDTTKSIQKTEIPTNPNGQITDQNWIDQLHEAVYLYNTSMRALVGLGYMVVPELTESQAMMNRNPYFDMEVKVFKEMEETQ